MGARAHGSSNSAEILVKAHLSDVLVDASEVDGGVAVVVHDVAAQLPDGALELVAV
jgi:hypothetical protein